MFDFNRIEITGKHAQDQKIAMTIIGKSCTKQSMQSVIEQKINSAQYIYICGDRPTNDSQEELKGEFTCKLGGSI